MSSIATITSQQGVAYALRNGEQVPLESGSPLFVSDTILTSSSGVLKVTFEDNSQISISPNSEITVADFVMTESDQSFVLNMGVGIMESISGGIVQRNPEGFKINTPLVTVGIRGTTTYHNVSASGTETHAIVSITDNHTVIITLPSGDNVVLTSNFEAVNIGPQGEMFNVIFIDQAQMEDLLNVFNVNNDIDILNILKNLQQFLSNLSVIYTESEGEILNNAAKELININTSESKVNLSTITDKLDLPEGAEKIHQEILEMLDKDTSYSPEFIKPGGGSTVNDNSINPPFTPVLPVTLTPPTPPSLVFSLSPIVGDSVFFEINGVPVRLGMLFDLTTFNLDFNPNGMPMPASRGRFIAPTMLPGETITLTAKGFSFIYNGETYEFEFTGAIPTLNNTSNYIDGTSTSTNFYFNTIASSTDIDINSIRFLNFNFAKYTGSSDGLFVLHDDDNNFFSTYTLFAKNEDNTFKMVVDNFKIIDGGSSLNPATGIDDFTDKLFLDNQGGTFNVLSTSIPNFYQGQYGSMLFQNFEVIDTGDMNGTLSNISTTLQLTKNNDSLMFDMYASGWTLDSNIGSLLDSSNNTIIRYKDFKVYDGGEGYDTVEFNDVNATFNSEGFIVSSKLTGTLDYYGENVQFKNFEKIGGLHFSGTFDLFLNATGSDFEDKTYTIDGAHLSRLNIGVTSMAHANYNVGGGTDVLELYITSPSTTNQMTFIILGYSADNYLTSGGNLGGKLAITV